MTTTNNTTENNCTGIIVAFHIGRGGRFHNPGFVSFIGEKEIGYFTEDLFFRYEKQDEVLREFEDHEELEEIRDLMYNRDLESLAKYGINADHLGEIEYYEGASGESVGLTEKQYQSGIGTINIDHSYNTTYTKYVEDCNEKELNLINDYTYYKSYELNEYVKEALGIVDEQTEDEE